MRIVKFKTDCSWSRKINFKILAIIIEKRKKKIFFFQSHLYIRLSLFSILFLDAKIFTFIIHIQDILTYNQIHLIVINSQKYK